MAMKFYTSVAKGLKFKTRKFWGLIYAFVEVTGGKLAGKDSVFRSNPPYALLGKAVLKIRCSFTGEHPCQSVISIKLKVAKRLYRNHISTWLFSCKFAAYFQDTFS